MIVNIANGLSGMREGKEQNGTNADPVFSGNGKDEAYDKQREEPSYYTARPYAGDTEAGGGLGSASFCGKRAQYCADRVRQIFAEEIRTADAAV